MVYVGEKLGAFFVDECVEASGGGRVCGLLGRGRGILYKLVLSLHICTFAGLMRS